MRRGLFTSSIAYTVEAGTAGLIYRHFQAGWTDKGGDDRSCLLHQYDMPSPLYGEAGGTGGPHEPEDYITPGKGTGT